MCATGADKSEKDYRRLRQPTGFHLFALRMR
jgi:hypothetical protein